MHVISDNDLFQRLAFENPWWNFKPTTRIEFRHPPQRVFFPSFFNRIMKADEGEVLCLAGPLHVGKTVMLRQAVARLIEEGIAPTRVFFASLTTPSFTTTDPGTLFEMFCRRYRHGFEEELFVFFDEIQYIKGWQDAILELAKMRPKTRFVCSISAGTPATERFSVFVLPPLTFLEFMRFRGSEEKLFGPAATTPGGKAVFKKSQLPVLNQEFMRWINFGGFPESIMSKTERAPPPTFIRDGLTSRVLHKDLSNLFGISDAQEVNRVFAVLAFNTGREISIDELSKTTSVAKNTLRKYLEYLEAASLITRIDRVDQNGNPFQRAVGFKIFLTTPCLYAALFGPSPIDHDAFPRLVQTAVVSQWQATEAEKNMAYASWRGGDVDLVGFDPKTNKPSAVFEMDWTDRYQRSDQGPTNLVQFVRSTNGTPNAHILTRALARPGRKDEVDIRLVPAALYCYWLNRGRHPHRLINDEN